jgi:hypothetical protein
MHPAREHPRSPEGLVDDEAAITQIADALRAYVSARPNAADSARGIREWWNGGQVPTPTPHQFEQALLRLEAEGLVARERLPDGGELWRAAPPLQ